MDLAMSIEVYQWKTTYYMVDLEANCYELALRQRLGFSSSYTTYNVFPSAPSCRLRFLSHRYLQ